MNKENWLLIRTQLELPVEVFYEYYKELGGLLPDVDSFTHKFVEIMSFPMLFVKNGKQITVNYETAIRRVYNHFDKKFNLES